MATLLRSEYDIIRSRQSLDDFRRLLSLLAEDEAIFIAEDEVAEDAEDIVVEGFVVDPEFGTTPTRPSGEPDVQVESNETEEQHLVSVPSPGEGSSPFVSPATEAERVAAEAAAAELENEGGSVEPEAEDAAVSPDGDAAQPESELSEEEASVDASPAGEDES